MVQILEKTDRVLMVVLVLVKGECSLDHSSLGLLAIENGIFGASTGCAGECGR